MTPSARVEDEMTNETSKGDEPTLYDSVCCAVALMNRTPSREPEFHEAHTYLREALLRPDPDSTIRTQRDTIARLTRENQELRAAHYDATDGISGTLLKDQIEGLTRELEEARRALSKIAVVEPTLGKASKNRGAMLQMQAIARAALPHPASETQG